MNVINDRWGEQLGGPKVDKHMDIKEREREKSDKYDQKGRELGK